MSKDSAIYPDIDRAIYMAQIELDTVKEQEVVAKETKDLGYLRFLVEKRNQVNDKLHQLRLDRSLRLKQEAIKAEGDVKQEARIKARKAKEVPNGN